MVDQTFLEFEGFGLEMFENGLCGEVVLIGEEFVDEIDDLFGGFGFVVGL